MRSLFIPQMTIGCVPIDEIEFDVFCRHELIPILMALQYLYVQRRETVIRICDLIRQDINSQKSTKWGCEGMTFWEIFILASIRLGCNYDYDQLSDLATNHRQIRRLLCLSDYDQKRYPKSTINDNLISLSARTLDAISMLVVQEGHQLKSGALDKVRGDSYVMKKNIHYPTDRNLFLDSIRKIIHLSHSLAQIFNLGGWRKHDYLYKKAKQIQRKLEKIARSKKQNKEQEIIALYDVLLKHGHLIVERSLETIHICETQKNTATPKDQVICDQIITGLQHYIGAAEYISELARRRIFNDEKIPNCDKVFSIFEPDTELINRGKQPNPIEFGHRVLIIQDKAGFIIHAQVMGIGITDEKLIVEVMKNLQTRYNNKIRAASFDKGFWTPNNLKNLSEIVPLVVLPKKGKRSQADKEREGDKEFGKTRKWHSGVESAIHALQAGNGLDLCRDKGADGYQRYLALGALGRNLQTLGSIFLDEERERKREELRMPLFI